MAEHLACSGPRPRACGFRRPQIPIRCSRFNIEHFNKALERDQCKTPTVRRKRNVPRQFFVFGGRTQRCHVSGGRVELTSQITTP